MEDRERLGIEKEKVYMLKNEKLRVEIIQLYYDILVAEYERRWKITELVMKIIGGQE